MASFFPVRSFSNVDDPERSSLDFFTPNSKDRYKKGIVKLAKWQKISIEFVALHKYAIIIFGSIYGLLYVILYCCHFNTLRNIPNISTKTFFVLLYRRPVFIKKENNNNP